MSRHAGLLLIVLLAAAGAALRWRTLQRSEALLAGEARGRATVLALHEDSLPIVAAGRPHPGLAALAASVGGLELLEAAGDVGHSYARDEVYVYGLATRERVEGGQRRFGYVLRAWPREFGVTGDQEYHIESDGQLWIGANERGRSGLVRGFPPPFPDPDVGQRKSAWWPAAP